MSSRAASSTTAGTPRSDRSTEKNRSLEKLGDDDRRDRRAHRREQGRKKKIAAGLDAPIDARVAMAPSGNDGYARGIDRQKERHRIRRDAAVAIQPVELDHRLQPKGRRGVRDPIILAVRFKIMALIAG